ncbi:hypothetical protein [Paracoccus litorisediminis]|uniref:Uncharacterized protein n=1 Tax=Paracoccus litorisediminis TaxID=2006130 RepID=A0A844HPC8_9RHOB|nr:hypothetical protein [Paracoccus litorisediminis]MTH60005.1 hypothetical protein [Paracoccus litorisediminis]
MSNYLNSVFSTSLSRGRLSYFLHILAITAIMIVGLLGGATIATVEGPSTWAFGLIFAGLLFLFGTVAGGFVFAQRIRDLGLPVAFVVVSYYTVSIVGSVLTAINVTANIIFSLIAVVFSLYVMLVPGKATAGRSRTVAGSPALT